MIQVIYKGEVVFESVLESKIAFKLYGLWRTSDQTSIKFLEEVELAGASVPFVISIDEAFTKLLCSKNCKFMNKYCCEYGCKGTKKEWHDGETKTGKPCSFALEPEAYQCPNCSKGIVNPSFQGTFVCDKCNFEQDYFGFKNRIEV